MTTDQISTWAIGYYVVDEVGNAGAIAGPFDRPDQAETDKLERNIAGDCGVWHRDGDGSFYAYPGYSVRA